MIGKRKIILPILASLLSFGMLSGCGETPSSTSDNTTTTSQTTSNSTPSEAELDLTAPALAHSAVTATDDEVLKIAKLIKEDVTALKDIPSSVVSVVKNFITKAYLTSSQIDLLLAAAADLKSGFLADNYTNASTSFLSFCSRLTTVLSSVDGDQIGYLLKETIDLLQSGRERKQIPSGLIFGLKSAEDYKGALNAFSTSFPGFKTQYDQYASYFDGVTPYQEGIEEGKVSITVPLALALGRTIHALLTSANKIFSSEEKTLALASLALAIDPDHLTYASEVKAKLNELQKNPVSMINHLGALLLSFKITKGSWTAIHDHAVWAVDAFVKAKKGIFFRSRAINITYYNGLIDFIQSKKNLVTGDMLAVVIKLVGTIGSKFSKVELEAINNAQGSTPANPISQLVALYDKSYAVLSVAEKATLSSLFTNLGLTYNTVYTTISGWSSLSFSSDTDKKTMGDYLTSLGQSVMAIFTPTVKKPDVDVYLNDPFVRKGAVLAPKAFHIDTGTPMPVPDIAPEPVLVTYSVSNIVAPSDTLGFHRGTFTLTEDASKTTYSFEFSYDVVETFIGINPDFYPSVYSPHGEADISNQVLYLQEGITLETLKTYNVSNFEFYEDDRTIHTAAFADPALTLTLSSTAVGNAYLLLAYRVSSSLTIYGVMKVKIFATSEIYYSTQGQTNYVVQHGDSIISVYKMINDNNGNGITLSYLYPSVAATLGINTDVLGLNTYNGHAYGATFDVRLNIVEASACTVAGIAEFMPYLKTTYTVGEAFSLAALKLNYTYKDAGGSNHSAGTGFVQNPQVVLDGFQTSTPTASSYATVHYLTFSFQFAYTVIAVS